MTTEAYFAITRNSGAGRPTGESSTMHSTRLSWFWRVEARVSSQGMIQAREGEQGKGLSRNSKEAREGGREVMASLSKLERLLLDRSRKARKGSELKDDPGQRIEVRWVWVTVSLVREVGRWEVDRHASLPLVIVNVLTPSNPLRFSVVLRPEQESCCEVQVQGRFEGREEQSLTFFWVGEERAGRSANKRGSSNILV